MRKHMRFTLIVSPLSVTSPPLLFPILMEPNMQSLLVIWIELPCVCVCSYVCVCERERKRV